MNSGNLREALRKHAEGQSEQAACLCVHGATQLLFTVVRANRGESIAGAPEGRG